LNDLGFSWRILEKDVRKEARENYAETWMRHFETLKAYKEEHGHTNGKSHEHNLLCAFALSFADDKRTLSLFFMLAYSSICPF
jgi:hypothetical protein